MTLQFRGREMAHPELGRKILDDVIERVGPIAKVETQARLEGRNMTMVLSPEKKAQEAIKKAAEDRSSRDGSRAAAADDAAAPTQHRTPTPTAPTPSRSTATEPRHRPTARRRRRRGRRPTTRRRTRHQETT